MPVGDTPGEGICGEVGAEPPRAFAAADGSVHAPTDDTCDVSDCASRSTPDARSPQLRDGCAPVGQATHMHDGSEEHSSDPCVGASRFDYSAVEGTQEAPEDPEEAEPLDDL